MPDLYGVNGSSSSNTLRITGLATGMDTDTMVKKMMAAENMKLDKMNQDKQYSQWKQESIRDIIKDFRNLRSKYLIIDSPDDTNLMKSFAYSGSTITATDSLGKISDSLVRASALPGATNGISEVTVKSVAKPAKIEGGKLTRSDATNKEPIGTSTKLSELGVKTGTIKITIPDGEANINVKEDMTIQNLIDEIYKTKIDGKEGTLYSKVKVNFSELTQSLTIETRETGSKQTLNVSDNNTGILKQLKLYSKIEGTSLSNETTSDTTLSKLGMTTNQNLSIQVNGIDKTVNLTTGMKISDVIATLKSEGITANFDNTSKKFSICTQDGSDLSIKSDFSPLNLKSNVTSTGQDAEISITPPGATVGTTVIKSSNTFTIDNMTYNLVKDPNGTPYTVTLNTKADAQKTVDRIKDFVGKYNELMKKITDKISEKKEYSYKPLAYEQRKEMKEEDIKKWEEKAKKGILKNDMELENIANQMRRSFTDGIKDSGLSLKDIGIDTYGSFEAITKPGQLKIDEVKLKKAVETRGDQVMNLFTKDYDGPTPNFPGEHASKQQIENYEKERQIYKTNKYNSSGIFERIEDIINDSSVKFDGNLLKRAGFEGTSSDITNDLTKKIKDQDKKIKELSVKLSQKETYYYNMFAKLETAMNKLNSQQSWLMQQLGGGK